MSELEKSEEREYREGGEGLLFTELTGLPGTSIWIWARALLKDTRPSVGMLDYKTKSLTSRAPSKKVSESPSRRAFMPGTE